MKAKRVQYPAPHFYGILIFFIPSKHELCNFFYGLFFLPQHIFNLHLLRCFSFLRSFVGRWCGYGNMERCNETGKHGTSSSYNFKVETFTELIDSFLNLCDYAFFAILSLWEMNNDSRRFPLIIIQHAAQNL